MTSILPCPGTSIDELDTPMLVIELPKLEKNIETIHKFFRDRPAKVRSVTKGHKCPAIAQKQMVADGAIQFGLCCAKVSEAEVMAEAGARHIRMIEQVVGKQKIDRLMALARHTHIIALVDDGKNADQLAEAAAAHGIILDVLVEIEIGLNRCGVLPGAPAVNLAQHIAKKNSLNFAGLSAHEGTMAISDPDERVTKVRQRVQRLLDCREDVEGAGLSVDLCGAGSTTTWKIAGSMEGITEIDAGTYALMDRSIADAMPDLGFDPALTVITTVISRPTTNRAVIDCGHKAIGRSGDGGMPVVIGVPGARVDRINSEHGILALEGDARSLKLGEKVALGPRYGAAAVAAYDHYVGVRDQTVECVWQIAARVSHQ
jgi:D-serine deaminase-like pyridoxal phosphate-dependent protein